MLYTKQPIKSEWKYRFRKKLTHDFAGTEQMIDTITESCRKLTLVHTSNGPGSSVGIATDYGLDGPGSNLGGDEIFRLSRPAMGPTQPPVKWLPGLSRGRGVLLITHPLLVPRPRKSRAITLPTLWATPGLLRDHFTLPYFESNI